MAEAAATVMPGRMVTRTNVRPVKRQLSLYEKQSLDVGVGRYLVMPSHPNTEIEELVDIGVNPYQVFGVEYVESYFDTLRAHYRDLCHMHHGDVFEFMANTQAPNSYRYAHIDLYGHLNEGIFNALQAWRRIPARHSRLRVTTFSARRSPMQLQFEQELHEAIIMQLCQLGYDHDTSDAQRWISLYDSARGQVQDTTRIVVGLAMLNLFFGIEDHRAYTSMDEGKAILPVVSGNHIISSIERWTYREADTNNHMQTVWFDLKPLPTQAMRHSSQWILNEVYKMLAMMEHHIPTFRIAFFQ